MSGTFAWGLDACIRLGSVVCPLLAVGRYAVSADYGNTTSVTYGQSGSSVMYYATGANFFFYPNVITGLLLGLEKGSQNISVTSTASASTLTYEGSSSSFFAAPKVGYYYPWGMFSGGGELIYLFGLSSDSPKALILFASIKIWF